MNAFLSIIICVSVIQAISANYYVKIQNTGTEALNLGEVTAYLGASSLTASSCSLSSTLDSSFSADHCCDGNINTICHADFSNVDPSAYFIASFTSQFDEVVVANRQDCCQIRIVGAIFSIYDDAGNIYYQTTLATEQSSYTFSGIALTVAPTVIPTAIPSASPTAPPSTEPSADPSVLPTAIPSDSPTVLPTTIPSSIPSANPSAQPSFAPSPHPTATPTHYPTAIPTKQPTALPTQLPTPKKGIIGVAYGGAAALSRSELSCLHDENHISFMVARGYMTWRSPTAGVQSTVDPNLCKHLRLATNSSVKARGIYVMARPFDGLSAYDPLRDLKRILSAECPEYVSYHKYFTRSFRVWLGVSLHSSFENNGWFTDVGRNRKWFESLIGYCKRYFKAGHCGVWSSAAAWETVFGEVSYYNSTVMKDLALWYSLPSDGSPNFKDYDVGGVQIGGWTTPLMKQFRAPSEMCGVRVGVNWAKE